MNQLTKKMTFTLLALSLVFVFEGSALAKKGGKKGPVDSLRFHASQGWSAPIAKMAKDRMSINLRFRNTPANAQEALAKQLTERKRRIFTQIAVREESKFTHIELQLARPLASLKRKKFMKKSWRIRVQLQASNAVQVPSYASIISDDFAKIVLEEAEKSLWNGEADCSPFKALAAEKTEWSKYMNLAVAECIQTKGYTKKSRKMALRIIRNAEKEPALAMLTALRLKKWKRQKAIMLPKVELDWNAMPAPLAQELGLRLARYYFARNLHKAADYLANAAKAGEFSPRLLDDAHQIRFDVLQRLLAEGNYAAEGKSPWTTALSIVDAFPLPSSTHPTHAGTTRAAALILAWAGHSSAAQHAASDLKVEEQAVLDPDLKSILAELDVEPVESDENVETPEVSAKTASNDDMEDMADWLYIPQAKTQKSDTSEVTPIANTSEGKDQAEVASYNLEQVLAQGGE